HQDRCDYQVWASFDNRDDCVAKRKGYRRRYGDSGMGGTTMAWRRGLHALRAALFLLLALGHDRRAQAAAEIVRQFIELGIAIDFDGFLGGVAHHVAVVAPGEVIF